MRITAAYQTTFISYLTLEKPNIYPIDGHGKIPGAQSTKQVLHHFLKHLHILKQYPRGWLEKYIVPIGIQLPMAQVEGQP